MKHPRARSTPILVCLAFSTLLVACGSESATAPGEDLRLPQLDLPELRTLALGLNEWDIDLEFAENVEDPIFPAPADLYRYGNADDVRLYGFSTLEAADAALATLSSDGRTVDGDPIPWSDPVHYYRDERLVVLHVGSSGRLEIALQDILGGHVAGDG